jgi:hypothetical protein
MNNEPVAWIHKTATSWVSTFIHPETEPNEWLPLYTHPAKTEDEGKVCARCGAIAYDPVITQTAKTLTDEEITDVYVECMLPYGEFNEHEFARAILLKAQEK